MITRKDHATVAVRRLLRAIAEHVVNDTALQKQFADLLGDKFTQVMKPSEDA